MSQLEGDYGPIGGGTSSGGGITVGTTTSDGTANALLKTNGASKVVSSSVTSDGTTTAIPEVALIGVGSVSTARQMSIQQMPGQNFAAIYSGGVVPAVDSYAFATAPTSTRVNVPAGGTIDINVANVAVMSFDSTGVTASKNQSFLRTTATININSAATDVATFSGLPAKYILRRVIVHTPSAAVTTATIDVRTAAGGAGTALVAAFLLSGLTATSSFVDATLAAGASANVRTETSLVVRNVTAEGSAKTVSITLEIQPLI